MDELFNYYISAGDITEALHLYSRGMREYCSQFKHIIQVFSVLFCGGKCVLKLLDVDVDELDGGIHLGR